MGKVHRAIGIDLGTTNSVMAMMHRGEPKIVLNALGSPLTPSAVSVDKRRELLVGEAAKSRAFDRNTVLSIKRFIGLPYELVQDDRVRVSYDVSAGPGGEVRVHFNDHTYSATEISAMILYRLRQDAQDRLGEPVGRAVITVPAYFNDAQVAATREAGRMAGFTVMRILREPMAAALAFGLDRAGDGTDASVLVYDLGGGTFDISIMTLVEGIFDVRGIEGDRHLGGDDFDFEIMNHLYRAATGGQDLKGDPAARRLLKHRAEEAKTELSSVTCVEINIPSIGGAGIETELTRDEFNHLIEPWIQRTIDLVYKAMRETNMSPALIQHILLVGGSTLIPYVQERLRQEFGQEKIRKNVDPMHCVALGAAIQTSLLNQIECPNPKCHDVAGRQTQNPIEAEKCFRCGTSLVGFEVVTCPACFVPNDVTQRICHACQVDLRTRERPVAAAAATAPQMWKCANCGHPRNPIGAQACEVCGQPREAGGVKCNKCGQLNPPGAVICRQCGEPLSIVFEAIPDNIGIQMQDGRMTVLFGKNTGYPTPKPLSVNLYTDQADQRRLEIVLREGPSDLAAENEYCGVVLLDLPPNLPKGTAVTISFGLDSDGTILATVQLRDYPDRRATARIARGGATLDRVHFSVTAPPELAPGTACIVDVWAHLEHQREAVIQRAREAAGHGEVYVKSKGPLPVARDTVLTVRLRLEGLVVEDSEDTIWWDGSIGNATFAVRVPADAHPGPKAGSAAIYIDGLQIGKIHFVLQVGTTALPACEIPVRQDRHRKAFASYAHQDLDKVLARIQGIQKAAPDLDIFLDVLSLRSGQDWAQELWRIIPASDIFYLFWSESASRSEWVEREWRCGLRMRGIGFIDPVPLVSPEQVPPPPELASKHFDDWVLAFMATRGASLPSRSGRDNAGAE